MLYVHCEWVALDLLELLKICQNSEQGSPERHIFEQQNNVETFDVNPDLPDLLISARTNVKYACLRRHLRPFSCNPNQLLQMLISTATTLKYRYVFASPLLFSTISEQNLVRQPQELLYKLKLIFSKKVVLHYTYFSLSGVTGVLLVMVPNFFSWKPLFLSTIGNYKKTAIYSLGGAWKTQVVLY